MKKKKVLLLQYTLLPLKMQGRKSRKFPILLKPVQVFPECGGYQILDKLISSEGLHGCAVSHTQVRTAV